MKSLREIIFPAPYGLVKRFANSTFCQKMKSRARLKRVVWVGLLPVGALLLLLANQFYQHRYDDSGFGTFHGFAGGSFSTTDEDFMFIRFEGRTKSELRWSRPVNYRYVDVDFEWEAESSSGEGVLNLPTMTLEHLDESTKINEEWFIGLNGHEPSAKAFMNLLIAARDGTLPRPRHHWHHFDGDLDGTLAHFSLGSRYPYSILVWGIVWAIATIIVLMHQKKPIEAEQVADDQLPARAESKAE
ncbi:MAG: hypothetical protein ACI8UZ_002386 [Akkermansiaceae bacterium]